MGPSNSEGFDDHDGSAAMTPQGGTGVQEGRGGTEVTEGRSRAGERSQTKPQVQWMAHRAMAQDGRRPTEVELVVQGSPVEP